MFITLQEVKIRVRVFYNTISQRGVFERLMSTSVPTALSYELSQLSYALKGSLIEKVHLD